MSDQDKKGTLTMSPGRLSLTKTVEGGKVKQNFTHGRSKTVTVEVRKTRTFASNESGKLVELKKSAEEASATKEVFQEDDHLTEGERKARLKALQHADEFVKKPLGDDKPRRAEVVRRPVEEETPSDAKNASAAAKKPVTPVVRPVRTGEEEEESGSADRNSRSAKPTRVRREEPRRNAGKITVSQAMNMAEERVRSLSSIRRAREKAKRMDSRPRDTEKVFREVIIPENITVQELANRMTERAVDVVKALMKMGTMATVNQIIDADTAELIVTEFGHKVRRVAEGDVENVLREDNEDPALLKPRAPVITVMGHVDHGKTSLLDALRKTNVVSGEAGGITQHIGAYQVDVDGKERITFLDTPGHEAFTSMRARGAKVTDIVILVVAADDGIKEQTKEAIIHAKTAQVPIIVAVNKIDKPGADPNRVKNELMQYELVPEEFGGDVIVVPVSAKEGTGLDQLKDSILLQAEVLELKANPDRPAVGIVLESKIDKGRGTVASILVQRGTMRTGDIVIAGGAYGKVRALINDRGQNIESAGPSVPVEVLGLDSVPDAGDEFAVVENEKTARDITEYRRSRQKQLQRLATTKTLDQLFASQDGKAKDLALIIKADVQGSAEAISGSLQKLSGDEVNVRVISSSVGGITESDVTLAQTTGAIIIAFNVRAGVQAKELAQREKIDIRYYSIIYEVVDDVKAAISGMLSPTLRENFLGYARIQQVFEVSKIGKVAGCMVTEGVIKRGCKVRLLRDNVVIHEGSLKTLKRFKDDVKEVKSGMECGMAFENYEDIRENDQIECFEVEEVARTVA